MGQVSINFIHIHIIFLTITFLNKNTDYNFYLIATKGRIRSFINLVLWMPNVWAKQDYNCSSSG